jgi:hypothetical protein
MTFILMIVCADVIAPQVKVLQGRATFTDDFPPERNKSSSES